jgi:hypothetical protein
MLEPKKIHDSVEEFKPTLRKIDTILLDLNSMSELQAEIAKLSLMVGDDD